MIHDIDLSPPVAPTPDAVLAMIDQATAWVREVCPTMREHWRIDHGDEYNDPATGKHGAKYMCPGPELAEVLLRMNNPTRDTLLVVALALLARGDFDG